MIAKAPRRSRSGGNIPPECGVKLDAAFSDYLKNSLAPAKFIETIDGIISVADNEAPGNGVALHARVAQMAIRIIDNPMAAGDRDDAQFEKIKLLFPEFEIFCHNKMNAGAFAERMEIPKDRAKELCDVRYMPYGGETFPHTRDQVKEAYQGLLDALKQVHKALKDKSNSVEYVAALGRRHRPSGRS